jgi:peroxiredoxin
VAISVDSPEVSRDLSKKAGYAFSILSDPNAEVIRRYDLLHVGGGPDGHDIARPAELLVDSSRVVCWVNFTEERSRAGARGRNARCSNKGSAVAKRSVLLENHIVPT